MKKAGRGLIRASPPQGTFGVHAVGCAAGCADAISGAAIARFPFRTGDRLRAAEFVGFGGWAGPVQRALWAVVM
jgi:hypothetical protein